VIVEISCIDQFQAARIISRLLATIKKRTARLIRRLEWRQPVGAPERYWHIGSDWALGYDEA
jgi:hypothetical protein